MSAHTCASAHTPAAHTWASAVLNTALAVPGARVGAEGGGSQIRGSSAASPVGGTPEGLRTDPEQLASPQTLNLSRTQTGQRPQATARRGRTAGGS